MKNKLFVLTRIERGEIKDQQVIADGAKMMRIYKEETQKAKLRAFGGDLFFEGASTLSVGQSSSVGDFDGNRITVHCCLVQ